MEDVFSGFTNSGPGPRVRKSSWGRGGEEWALLRSGNLPAASQTFPGIRGGRGVGARPHRGAPPPNPWS